MECYNLNCKERDRCDRYKKMTCIYRLDKEQQKFINKLNKYNYCKTCSGRTIRAKQGLREINLCTRCGVRRNLHNENKQKAI